MKIDEFSCGGLVVYKNKAAVVFQDITNTWTLPKGHVQPGESLEETALREIYEETGLRELILIKKLGSYIRGTKKRPHIDKKITIFLFTTTQDKLKSRDPKNPKAKWVLLDELENVLTYKEDREFFRTIKKKLSSEFTG